MTLRQSIYQMLLEPKSCKDGPPTGLQWNQFHSSEMCIAVHISIFLPECDLHASSTLLQVRGNTPVKKIKHPVILVPDKVHVVSGGCLLPL